jgi:23S rRNA pseudouridine2605 synthase
MTHKKLKKTVEPKIDQNHMPLNKYIAQAGICSRRNAVELIKDGHVKVSGKVVREPGFKVTSDHSVKVKNRLIQKEEPIYVLMNKPKGVVTTVSDEKGRPAVVDLIKLPKKQRIYPVGRLDINTTGVLILTNDGYFAQKMAHPSSRIPKMYEVTLHKDIYPEALDQLKKGIRLEDGVIAVDDLYLIPGPKKNKIRVTLHSGRNRIVRRMFEHMGLIVEKLERVSFGGITKRGLARGESRRLTKKEIERLKKFL